MILIFEIGSHWPPPQDKKRLARYTENKLLYDGRFEDVFFRLQAYYWQRNNLIAQGYLPGIDVNASKRNLEMTYIAVRIVSLLVKKPTDLLFGEDSTFSSGQAQGSPEQAALDRIIEENDFRTTLMELGLGTAIRGDGILKVRIDPSLPYPTVIEAQDASYWFPETAPDDRRRILAHHICVPIYIDPPQNSSLFAWVNPPEREHYLRVESHYPGLIQNRLFRLTPNGIDMFGQPDYLISEELPLDSMFPGLDAEIQTGVPYPLIVHTPNQRTDGDLYGTDDIDELKPLLDELSNRLTQISQILDKHADPIIALPAGSLEAVEDESGKVQYVYRASANKAIEVDGKDDITPQYITWDGHLNAAFSELDRVLDMIFMISEIPRLIVGGVGESGGGTSGAAALNTKYRLLPLLAKVNRKKRYLDKGVRQALYVAQLLEDAYVKTYGASAIPGYQPYTPSYPKVIWADGLPRDDMQEAQIMQIRTGGEPTIDQIEAIMRLDGKSEAEAQETVRRIKESQAALSTIDTTAKAGALFNGGSGVSSGGDVNNG